MVLSAFDRALNDESLILEGLGLGLGLAGRDGRDITNKESDTRSRSRASSQGYDKEASAAMFEAPVSCKKNSVLYLHYLFLTIISFSFRLFLFASRPLLILMGFQTMGLRYPHYRTITLLFLQLHYFYYSSLC